MVQNVSRVVVRIAPAPLAVVDWLAFDRDGLQCGHGLASSVSQPWPNTSQLELAIPAAWLTAHRIVLPKVSEKQRQQLIAQALEDRVLGKLADFQWIASAPSDGACVVWVLERAKLAQLKTWASDHQLAFTRWIPEFALLPEHGNGVASAAVGLMARLGEDYIWLADEGELLAIRGEHAVNTIPLTGLIAPSKTSASFYRGKSTGVSLHISWPDWRWSIYLVGVCVVLVLLSLIMQWRGLATRETALRQEIRQTFASLYPGVPIVDPMLQWQSLQKQGGAKQSGADALDLLYRSAGQMAGELSAESISVKDGKVTIILPATQGSSLLSQLNSQGAKVNSTTLPDGRMNLELQP